MAEPQRFTFHLINKILIGIVILYGVAYIAAFYLSDAEKTPNQVGEALGTPASILMLAAIVALFVWYVSRKSLRAANITFGVLVVLGLLASLNNVLQSVNREDRINDFRDAMTSEVAEDVGRAREVSSEFMDDMIADSQGDEQKSYVATKAYMSELLDVREDWEAAFDAFLEDRIFDFTVLTSPDEYEFQKSVANAYAEESKRYAERYEAADETMRAKLEEAGVAEDHADEFMAGFSQASRPTTIAAIKLFRAHETAANGYHTMLGILEQSEWSFDSETEVLSFEDSEADDAYFEELDRVIAAEEDIEVHATELERIEAAKQANNQQ